MKLSFFIFCIFITINGVVFAQSNPKEFDVNKYFEKANSFYSKGEYDKALEIYKNLYSQGLVSSELFYNLSNTYYRLDKFGLAILFIEKAYNLSPRDKAINHNRRFMIGSTGDTVNSLENITHFFSLREIIYIWLVVWSVLFILLIFGLYVKNRELYWSKIVAFCSLLLVSAWILFVYEADYRYKKGVILSPDTVVYASPSQTSQAVFTLSEGKKIMVEQEQDNWYSIYIQDKGLEGWVMSKEIELV